MNTPLLRGEAIKTLIPQRDPILLVDTLYQCSESSCRTGLTVTPGGLFCTRGCLSAEGIVEHMAQSASAWLGYQTVVVRGERVRTGYIGEIRHLDVSRFPTAGQTIETTVTVLSETMGIALVYAETRCADEVIASGRLKIST